MDIIPGNESVIHPHGLAGQHATGTTHRAFLLSLCPRSLCCSEGAATSRASPLCAVSSSAPRHSESRRSSKKTLIGWGVPRTRLEDFRALRVVTNRFSMIRVGPKVYSVSSWLIRRDSGGTSLFQTTQGAVCRRSDGDHRPTAGSGVSRY